MSNAAQLESLPSKALAEHRSRIVALARARGVSNVRVFGSTARGADARAAISTCWSTFSRHDALRSGRAADALEN